MPENRERRFKRLNARQSEIVLDFLQKIPFSNSLKVFYLHLELPSDQENSNDFAVEQLWFGYGEETPYRPRQISLVATPDSRARFHTG